MIAVSGGLPSTMPCHTSTMWSCVYVQAHRATPGHQTRPPPPPPSPYLSLSFSLFPPCLYLRLPIFILHCLPYIMIRPLIYKTAPSFPCRDRLQNCPLASPCHTRGPPVMLSNTQHPGWFTNTVLLPLLVCLFLSTHTPLLSRPTNHRHTL